MEEIIEKIFNGLVLLDTAKREEAEYLLSKIKEEEELHKLSQTAILSDFKIKYYVIKHLSLFDYKSTIKDLIEFLFDDSKIIQRTAERALDNIRCDDKYDYLLDLISSPDNYVRTYAIKSLGRGEQANSVIPLLKILDDKDPDIRVQIIDSLRLIGDKRSEERVIKCLKDCEAKVRYAAAFYCGSRKVKKACSELLKLLDDLEPSVRVTSVWAIGQLKCRKSVFVMKNFLKKEKDRNVRNEMLRVMRDSGMADLLSEQTLMLSDTEDVTKPVLRWTLAKFSKERNFEKADICLFVEGSYPYVRGGVSSWVQEQIKYFKDLTFSIVHMVASSSEIKEFKYDLPKNILYYKDIYLYDLPDIKRKGKSRKTAQIMDLLFDFITSSGRADKNKFKHLCEEMGVMKDFQLDTGDLFFSPQAWNFIKKLYKHSLSDVPFLEYIWSYRSLVLPVYNILRATYPPASLFYTVLTGYAGLGAVISGVYYNRPVMVTEHGIYHRERMIEINQANWIYEMKQDGYMARETFTGLKKVWINLYLILSSLVYNYSDKISTLFSDNARLEIEAGADPDKIVIIPNGIDIAGFASVRPKDLNKDILTVTLVGRVVPIKDIKTYILAARLVCDEMGKKVKFLVMGPFDEDKEYTDECLTLINLLGLDGVVEFTGNVDLKKAFNDVDLVVLTSISEGQPLSLMESMSAGIPCVATNVGACKELLYGKDSEDEMLGKCGIITNVHAPTETAQAIMTILRDGSLYKRMALTGKTRMEKYYQKHDILERYGVEFKKLLKGEK